MLGLVFFFILETGGTFLIYGSSLPDKLDQMLFVEKGDFVLGSATAYYDEDEYPPNIITLPDYYIYPYPVTNEEYMLFLNEWYEDERIRVENGNIYYQSPEIILAQTAEADEDTPIYYESNSFYVPDSSVNYPVIEVTWFGALAYTEWLNEKYGLDSVFHFESKTFEEGVAGFRLPTECEWEKAAGWNPEENRKTKYGFQQEELSEKLANYNTYEDEVLLPPPRLTPVGYYNGKNRGTEKAVSFYGGYDFSGNVYEWCLDSYRSDYYSSIFRTGMTYHPWWYDAENPYAAVRGGAWLSYPEELRTANRSHFHKDTHCNFIGFRIVYQEKGD